MGIELEGVSYCIFGIIYRFPIRKTWYSPVSRWSVLKLTVHIANRFLYALGIYRPPNSGMDLFNECETLFQRCNADNRELLLVGDLNCDVSKVPLDPHTRQLIFLCSLYQIDQLIDKPTRVTDTSATMTDLDLTNVKENIHASGVIHLGISDHSLIYAVWKFMLPKTNPGAREIRDYKHFDAELFVEDLSQMPWNAFIIKPS